MNFKRNRKIDNSQDFLISSLELWSELLKVTINPVKPIVSQNFHQGKIIFSWMKT